MHTQSLPRYLAALCACGALGLVISRSAPLVADDAAGWVELLEKGDITKNWTTKGNWVTGKEGDVNLEPRRRIGLAALRRLLVVQGAVQGL